MLVDGEMPAMHQNDISFMQFADHAQPCWTLNKAADNLDLSAELIDADDIGLCEDHVLKTGDARMEPGGQILLNMDVDFSIQNWTTPDCVSRAS